MSMLKPIAPELFSLRDSSTGVTTQWRAASSAFQDMETMRDECVGNHMRRCNKIKCMDQRTRKYRKRVETSCSGTKHARCLHGTGVGSSGAARVRSSGAAMGASRMRRQRQKRQAPTWPTN